MAEPAPPPLLLASASPRRARLLADAGIPFEQAAPAGVDETVPPGADPAGAVRALAERKALAAARAAPGRRVLAADTLVFLEGRPLGKPRDRAEARAFLARLSGRTHLVATGVALVSEGRVRSGAATARVRFRTLSGPEMEAYARGGEGLDKAGGYALQGGAAAFVEALEGREDTVVGLPLPLVLALLNPTHARTP